jgi:4-aminobutyrate aminotransferase-like enzyme
VENKQTKEPATPAKIDQIITECKNKGLIVGKNGSTVAGFNNILTLSPPLSSTDEDFDFMVTTLKEVILQIV